MNPSHFDSSRQFSDVIPPHHHHYFTSVLEQVEKCNKLLGMQKVLKSLSVLEFCFMVKHEGKLLYSVD